MIGSTLVALVLTSYLGSWGDQAALYQGSIEPVFPQTRWVGHPYWEDENFHTGSICFDGNLYPSVQLRYNIYENILSVVAPESKLVVVPDPSKIDYFEMDHRLYIPLDGRFVCVPHKGQCLSMIHKREKQRVADVLDGKTFKHALTTTNEYYLLKADGTKIPVSNLRSLTKAYPQHKKAMRAYAKDYRLSFTGDSRYSSLVQSISYLDQLVSAEPQQEVAQTEETPTIVHITTPKGNLPDSIWSSVEPTKRVSAYHAYTPGSKVQLEYSDDDDDLVMENPGISDLEVLRETRTLEEVEVMGFRNQMSMQQGGMEAFRPSLLKNVPLVMGEADVVKLAMLLPGVSSTGEASSGLNVRGGASDQNLMLYNGNTVFNTMHMFGLFSAFNSDLVAESELYKGGIPSQYGGRLSSVMNIKGRVGDMQKFHGSVSIGLVTAKGMLEVPLAHKRASLIIGGRSTYSDWMLKTLPSKTGYADGTAGFWDLGGTLHCQLSNNHSLNVNAYVSKDRFAFTRNNKYRYANTNVSVELRSRFGESWSSVLTAGYDQYEYNNDDVQTVFSSARLSFDVSQYFVKGVANYELNDDHSLNFGVQTQLQEIMPGSYKPLGDRSNIVGRQLETENAIEGAAWAEDQWTIGDKWSLTGGVRLNLFKAQKKGFEHLYIQPDVRASIKYLLTENQSLKAGFNTLHQYIHKVSNTVIMSPSDTWVLSHDKIKPQSGWQGSIGWYWQSPELVYEFSAEGYWKMMSNYLTYRNGATLVMNEELYKDVVGVEGRAYGVELQIRKMTGKLTGWINYTYSRSQLKQSDPGESNLINHGEWFASDYDTPHDVKLVSNYKFTRRYSTSLNVNYKSGRPFTAPVGLFYNESLNRYAPLYDKRNECRMPYYLRMDWSFNFEPSHHLTNKTHRWLSMGVYNMLGRRNAYSIYYESDGYNVQGYQLSIFGAPIPYIAYNIKF